MKFTKPVVIFVGDSWVVSAFEMNCYGIVVKEHQVGANPTSEIQLYIRFVSYHGHCHHGSSKTYEDWT